MTRHPKLAEFVRDHALKRERVTLASGRTSDFYVDGKQVTFSPQGIALVVDALFEELAEVEFDAFGGMDMGGTPSAAAFALRSQQLGRPVPTFTVRKQVKAHGLQRRIEGIFNPVPARVVVVDDTITSGGSILEAIAAVRDAGSEVVLAMSVVDRGEGAAERLAAENIHYLPLVERADLDV